MIVLRHETIYLLRWMVLTVRPQLVGFNTPTATILCMTVYRFIPCITFIFIILFENTACVAQKMEVSLQDMSFWQSRTAQNWQIAATAIADPDKDHDMSARKGKGVLVNLPDSKNRSNLLSIAEFGDVEVSFEFMMAKFSNSGFYLQGRYEVQLLDSWGRIHPAFNDCGGIFARRRHEPQEQLYEGYPPLQNTAKAPGLWQKMEIKFKAPRLDAQGKKIANALLEYVRLNGVTIQENRSLTGPTGGPISESEAAKGPIMIQGDHGAVAFRNIQITELNGVPPAATDIGWQVVYGAFRDASEFKDKKVDLSGKNTVFTWEVARNDNDFAITTTATLDIKKAGKYQFASQTGGNSILRVNGTEILNQQWTYSSNVRTASIDLPVGKIPMELIYFKMDEWMPPILALEITSPDGNKGSYHSPSSTLALVPADPIYLDAEVPTVFRSFVDYSENGRFKHRIVHPANVGHPDLLHYTYNLDNGALAQLWRGHFLNTSPMWDNRGDGSARPRGAVLPLGDSPVLMSEAQLADTNILHQNNAHFRPLGYDIETDGMPDFRYQVNGVTIKDHIRVMDGKSVTRHIQITDGTPDAPLFCRLVKANDITEVKKGLYSINDGSYFIRLPKGVKPMTLVNGSKTIMYLPLVQELTYELLW